MQKWGKEREGEMRKCEGVGHLPIRVFKRNPEHIRFFSSSPKFGHIFQEKNERYG